MALLLRAVAKLPTSGREFWQRQAIPMADLSAIVGKCICLVFFGIFFGAIESLAIERLVRAPLRDRQRDTR